MDGELLLHLDVVDTIGERGYDGLVRHLGELEVNTVEALNVFLEGLPRLLLDAAQVTCDRGRSRVPWKLAMKWLRISSQEEIEPGGRFRSQEEGPSLRDMGNQFAMIFSSPLAVSMLSL